MQKIASIKARKHANPSLITSAMWDALDTDSCTGRAKALSLECGIYENAFANHHLRTVARD